MRASRRTVPWVRVAAPAGACRRLAALACKVRANLLAYTMFPRCMRGNPLPAPLDLRRLRIFGQRDKLRADRSKMGVRSGRKEEAAQRGIQGASGDGGAFGGEDPGGAG